MTLRPRNPIRALRNRWRRRREEAAQRALPKGWLTPEEDYLVPPRSVWIGPGDPISHYYRWVWEYLAYLTLLADLKRTSVVLELGCGHGRTAHGLLGYMRSPGRYTGLDVDGRRIEDAQRRIESRWPNFQFIHADVYSRQYNPRGRIRSTEYTFPFESDTFDVIYAASLFSHLLPGECARYLSESARVLKPGGKCLFSFFMLDNYRGAGTTITSNYAFEHRLAGDEGVAVRSPEAPDDLIGYTGAAMTRLATTGGLQVLRVIPGLWTENTDWAVNEQDLIVLARAN